MKRFKCFTTIMQNNSSADDDDEDDEKKEEVEEDTLMGVPGTLEEPDGEDEKETTRITTVKNDADSEDTKIEVTLPERNNVNSKFTDSGFWKLNTSENDLDDLLADYE